jgi:hypothetical protein
VVQDFRKIDEDFYFAEVALHLPSAKNAVDPLEG